MSKRADFTSATVKRLLRGVIDAGLPVDSFALVVEQGRLMLLPRPDIALPASSPEDGEDAWDKALGLQ